MKKSKCEVIVDGETKTADVKFDHGEGWLILILDDDNATELRFNLADIEELGARSKILEGKRNAGNST